MTSGALGKRLASAVRSVERFCLPNVCICCDGRIPNANPDGLVCGTCWSRLRPVGVGCERCGQPHPPIGPCRFCAEWEQCLASVRTAVWLTREAKAIVHRLKYGHARRLGDLAAEAICRHVPSLGPGWLIPVPVTPARLHDRGYNQAQAIAEGLVTRWQAGLDTKSLRRVRQPRSQTSLTPEGRAANVAGAFVAKAPRGARQTAVLVDDVLTTGATLDACASALARSGWWRVRAVTFSRALPYELAAMGY